MKRVLADNAAQRTHVAAGIRQVEVVNLARKRHKGPMSHFRCFEFRAATAHLQRGFRVEAVIDRAGDGACSRKRAFGNELAARK